MAGKGMRIVHSDDSPSGNKWRWQPRGIAGGSAMVLHATEPMSQRERLDAWSRLKIRGVDVNGSPDPKRYELRDGDITIELQLDATVKDSDALDLGMASDPVPFVRIPNHSRRR